MNGEVVRTRFAPSPTGYLHIGGARTALFSWAFARKRGGEFVLRIEDTDRVRSTATAKKAITDSLDWLGLGYSGPHYQSGFIERHREVAWRLVEEGKAYRCYMTAEELEQLRSEMRARKQKPRYDRRWRDSDMTPPAGVEPAVRLKMPLEGRTVIRDLIKGDIAIDNRELDDPVILRADGTPTYNFACAVDDYDMGITHVIRGEDHISNTPKQTAVAEALGGPLPAYAHMPLILAAVRDEAGNLVLDEADSPRYERMSKRSGAVDVMHYAREGFLPRAVINYLATLGWSPGEREIFDADEFVERFDLVDVNLPASRFDLDKLRWVNNRHMRLLGPARLGEMTDPPMAPEAAELYYEHAHTLRELEDESVYLRQAPVDVDLRGAASEGLEPLADFTKGVAALELWNVSGIKSLVKDCAKRHGVGFKAIGMPLRAALTGRRESPDIAVVADLLGREETLKRLEACGMTSKEAD